MREFISLLTVWHLLALFLPGIAYAQFPSPTYQSITVAGATQGSTATFTGPTNLLGGGQIYGSFTGPSTINGLTAGLIPLTTAQIAGLGSPQVGWTVYNSDCANGAGGLGCVTSYNGTAWVKTLTPSTLSMTIGGQSVTLGGATANQGNGSLIQTATGATITGDCPQYNAGGALIDSGNPCGGGSGGNGNVTAGPQGAVTVYTGGGTSSTVGALAIVNNAVVSTSGSGVPSESTSLPPGLSIPTAAISSATLTGATTIGAATYTGKQTYATSTVSNASANIPPGAAPTSPVAGDEWATGSGLFYRAGSTSQGPFLYNVTTTAPLTGGGVGPSLTVACPTCATVSGGGALSATAPLTLTDGLFALGPQTVPLTWIADSTYIVHNDSYPLVLSSPWSGNATVSSVVYQTGGTTSPSFSLTYAICTGASCTNVGTCANITVNNTSGLKLNCTAPNTLGPNQTLQMNITNVSGSPSSAYIQTNLAKPAA